MIETKITKNQQELKDSLKQNSLWRTIIYSVIVSLLTCMLIFCYIMVFSSNFYIKGFDGKYNVGVVDISNHNSINVGQLVSIEEYNSSNDIKIGDEVYYSSVTEGSGEVVSLDELNKGYIIVSVKEQNVKISASTIIGKIESKTNFWGYVFWFFDSVFGIVVLNILLTVTVITHIILVATIETSKKGRQLRSKLKKQAFIKMSVNSMYNQFGMLNVPTEKMLSGTYEHNVQEIINFSKNSNMSAAYFGFLINIHDVYLPKQNLSVDDKIRITNCVELMFLSDELSEEQEYLIRDLLLKTNLVDFDVFSFVESGKQYLQRNKNVEALYNLQSILYVLMKTNSVDSKILELIEEMDNKIDLLNVKTRIKELKKLNNLLKTFIN